MTDLHIDQTSKTKKLHEDIPDEKKRKEVAVLDAEKQTEEVMAAGQDDLHQAIKEIEKQVQQEQKEEKQKEDDILNKLDMKRKYASSYRDQLAQSLAEMLMNLDWVRGWTADCVVTSGQPISIKGKPFQTQKGILLVVCTPDGRVFHQGMKVTGEPLLDYAGLYTLALQVENTMDKERGLLLSEKTPGILDKDGKPLTTGNK